MVPPRGRLERRGVTKISADNGVYILETEGPEYRVAYVNAIDNIFGEYNDTTLHWDGDSEMILECFGKSKVFTDLTEAWDYATTLSVAYAYLEDGVCLIPEFKKVKFGKLLNE